MSKLTITAKIIAASALITLASAAFSQKFPEKAIQLVVPFGPGGTTDLMARLLQDELGKALGSAGSPASIAIVNTAGAGGMIGMANVARAKADGYTLAMTTTGPQTLQPARRDAPPYQTADFDYLCGTYDVPVMAMVASESPHKTFQALMAYGKANPGKLNYGNSGTGGVLHISMLELTRSQGVDAVAVPYKSTGDMIVPLRTQQIAMFNETPPIATQYQLRPLLALSDAQVAGYVQVPTAKQLGIATRASVWGGLVAPKGLPQDIKQKLEAACKSAVDTTVYKARAQAANNPLVWRSSEQFKTFAMAEHEKFKKVVKTHNLYER